jgi:hypothetical protein
MAAIVRSADGWAPDALNRSHGSTLDQLDDGSWEGVVVYYCAWANVQTLAPQRFVDVHPDFDSLTCNASKAVQLKGGWAKITATYRGLFGTPVGVEEIITSTSEAPIETHVNFVTDIGGTPDAPLNGAQFDSDGNFTGFQVTTDGSTQNPFAGIVSYLTPGTIYRMTTPQASRPTSLSGVGTVYAISDSVELPNSYMNWLLVSLTWKRYGAIWLVTMEFLLSGNKGWNSTIYAY